MSNGPARGTTKVPIQFGTWLECPCQPALPVRRLTRVVPRVCQDAQKQPDIGETLWTAINRELVFLRRYDIAFNAVDS